MVFPGLCQTLVRSSLLTLLTHISFAISHTALRTDSLIDSNCCGISTAPIQLMSNTSPLPVLDNMHPLRFSKLWMKQEISVVQGHKVISYPRFHHIGMWIWSRHTRKRQCASIMVDGLDKPMRLHGCKRKHMEVRKSSASSMSPPSTTRLSRQRRHKMAHQL